MGKIHLIFGDDESAIKHEAANIIRTLAGENPDAFGLDICESSDFISEETALQNCIESILTPSFLGGIKTIWLKNFSFEKEGGKDASDSFSLKLRKLSKILENDFPAEINFVISGRNLDQRKTFFKSCKSVTNEINIFTQVKLSDRDWESKVRQQISFYAEQKKLNLQRDAIEHLINVFGVNTSSIETELEKIYCFCGEKEKIFYIDICDICVGDRETEYFAFSSALAARNLPATLIAIKRSFSKEKDDSVAIGILSQTIGSFKQLLQMKLFLTICKITANQIVGTLQSPPQNLLFRLEKSCSEIMKMNPFAAKYKAQDAEKYNGKELVDAIHLLTIAAHKCVSSGVSRQLLLENLAFKIIK